MPGSQGGRNKLELATNFLSCEKLSNVATPQSPEQKDSLILDGACARVWGVPHQIPIQSRIQIQHLCPQLKRRYVGTKQNQPTDSLLLITKSLMLL
jgi:hypothetical protein